MDSLVFEISDADAPLNFHEKRMQQILETESQQSLHKTTKIIALKKGDLTLGSAQVSLSFNYLLLESIWIEPSEQKSGFGVRLYNEIEAFAKQQHCQKILLNTFDFLHALPFWQRMGFQQVGVVENCPVGHRLIYLEKTL